MSDTLRSISGGQTQAICVCPPLLVSNMKLIVDCDKMRQSLKKKGPGPHVVKSYQVEGQQYPDDHMWSTDRDRGVGFRLVVEYHEVNNR